MAINYPTSLDDLANVATSDTITAAHKNDLNDIVEALEAKVGVDNSAVTTSVDYKLRHLPAQEANLDIGAYELRAQTLESDVVTGTAPLTIASTTVNTNLNADLCDGKHVAGTNGAGEITTNDGTQTLTGKTLTSPTINTPTISGGAWTGGTDLAVADGGTGSSTAAAARTALGLDMFVTGDWILSTVTTARTGWTNVGATYADKFIRLGATADLTGAGADSHTHTTDYLPSHTHTGPSHTHTGPSHQHAVTGVSVANESAHTHLLTTNWYNSGGISSTYFWSTVPNSASTGSKYSDVGSAHTHSLSGSVDAGGTGATGASGTDATGATTAGSATTSSTSNVPVYIRVVVFQKN